MRVEVENRNELTPMSEAAIRDHITGSIGKKSLFFLTMTDGTNNAIFISYCNSDTGTRTIVTDLQTGETFSNSLSYEITVDSISKRFADKVLSITTFKPDTYGLMIKPN